MDCNYHIAIRHANARKEGAPRLQPAAANQVKAG